MSIRIELPDQEIAALRHLTKTDSDSDAVVRAAREFLRLARLRELKAASGKVDFDPDWQKWEDLELGETDLPR